VFCKLSIENIEVHELRQKEFFDAWWWPKTIFHSRWEGGCIANGTLVEIKIKTNCYSAAIHKKSDSKSARAVLVAALEECADFKSLPSASIRFRFPR
jgi:hypothetical protein